jgi:hypothetical protein
MSKRYISIFLPAALTLMLVGVGALLGAYECHRYAQTGDGHERFETFIQNVQSGHLEVTTDRWLKLVRQQQASRTAFFEFEIASRNYLLVLALIALAGILWQFYTFSRFSKRSNHDA